MKNVIILTCLVLSCGCISNSNKLVNVRAELIEYTPGAMHDSLEDGMCLWHDAAIFRIISPPEWKGTNLYVYCSPQPHDSVLRSVGAIYDFRIDEIYLVHEVPGKKPGTVDVYEAFPGALLELKKTERDSNK